MLLYPSINTLNEKTDSRYSLVILAAKRARDIVDGKPALTEEECERPVSQAAIEVADDMITYKRVEKPAVTELEIYDVETAEAEAEEAAETESEETAAEPEAEEAETSEESEEAPEEKK